MNNGGDNHDFHNCKDILSQMGPIETLLGSVSYNEIDGVDGKTQQLRASARVFKKMKFDLSNSEKKEVKKEEPKPEDVKPEGIKEKRLVNPLWSAEEKKMYFEALNEFGKDFESIHLSISTRLKKKGVPEEQIKTKAQMRHFYHRTFHMLLTYLKFSPDKIPKNAQELYALINYGEMRRKIGSISKKNLNKLNELMITGCTAVRIKGKTIRVKTPMCRALRRLNQLDEKYDDLKLPTRVLVELKPKDMVSFLRVQSMAQNPRIRMALSLQKRLSLLIACINNRWKSTEAVAYDNALIPTNVVTKDCVPDQKEIVENCALLTPLLRLSPPLDAKIEIPSVDISEYFTGQSICLTAFENRRNAKEESKKEENNEIKTEKIEETPKDKPPIITVNRVVDEAVNTILSLSTQDWNKNTVNTTASCNKKWNDEEKRLKIEQIREGWTTETCDSLTVGEIYLMFGSGSKLFLEYSWDPPKSAKNENFDPIEQENNLTNSLQKLLSVAKLQASKPTPKCTCGHVCGSKPTAQFKKPLSTKLVKKAQVVQEIPVNDVINPVHKIEDTVEDDSSQNSNSPMVHLFTQLDSMQKLNPKCRRDRPRCKQLVVERKLVPNKSETKHNLVSMNIVSENEPKPSSSIEEPKSLMDDKDLSELLNDNRSNMSTATGISKILTENENQWMSAEVTDYSLSSLLGHLDCKSNQSVAILSNDDSQLSHDVDSQLRTLLTETSVDYTAKFADLAAQVIDSKK